MFAMTIASDIHADLITPLGAYLRLAAEGGATFLLESVEKGRLGRYSLVGRGTRLVDFPEAERELAAGNAVVGYLAYDHVAELEPTVPLPDAGAGLPESRFVVADTLVRFDHAASVAEVLTGDREAVAAPPRGTGASRRRYRRASSETHALSLSGGLRARAFAGRRNTSGPGTRSRSWFPRGGATDGRLCPRALPVASPNQSLAIPLPARARRHRARRLLARDARQARRHAGEPEPDRGHDPPGRGGRGRAPRLREGQGGAHHAGRPRPQRPLARLPTGTVRVGTSSSRSATRTSRTSSREVAGELSRDSARSTSCAHASRPEPSPARRRCGRCRSSRSSRPIAAARTPARSATPLPDGDLDTCIAIRTVILDGGFARLQAGAGIVADSDPTAEHQECLSKLAALEAALEEAEAA